MTLEKKVKECENALSWRDLFSKSFDELKGLQVGHKKILLTGTRQDIRKISHLHAYDLLPKYDATNTNWLWVLNYVRQMLDDGEIDAETAHEIQETNGNAVSFQRLRTDKSTAKNYNNEGLLIESARFFPSGTVVRTFHNVFKDNHAWQLATKGQEFYQGLVDYIKKRFYSKNRLTEDGSYIAERITRASPIMPLLSEFKVLDNVFVNGVDLQEHFRDDETCVDDKVRMLSEITDIDLITSFFSPDFSKTRKGKALSTKGRMMKKPLFNPNDYRREVFEQILLKADREFRAELEENSIVNRKGEVVDGKSFEIFYSAGDERSEVLDLIGIEEGNTVRQRYFTPYDLNLGNIMLTEKEGNRHYTHIDFERAQQDSLVSVLFRRWAQSGIYDHTGSSHKLENGKTAEEQLLDNAYETIKRLHSSKGMEAPSREDFLKEFSMQKKKYLLRIARRYKSLEERLKGDLEELRANKRFFYTLFAYELNKEGKIDGIDDKKLAYLNTLFENPMSEDEMKEISDRFDPSFSSRDEISPLDVKDVESRNKELIEKYQEEQRRRKRNKWTARILAPALFLGAIIGGILGYKAYNKTEEDLVKTKRKYMITQAEKTLGRIDRHEMETTDALTNIKLREYERRLGDRMTARAAIVDIYSVYEAIEETGTTEWDAVREYLNNNGYPDVVWASRPYTTAGIDNWVWHHDTSRIEKEQVDKELKRAAAIYKQKKEAERQGRRRHCIVIPTLGTVNPGTGVVSVSYDCVEDPSYVPPRIPNPAIK